MMIKFRDLRVAAALLALIPAQAGAQSKEKFLEAFSGDWLIFDTSFSTTAAPCMLTLGTTIELRGVVEESQLHLGATPKNCVEPLSNVTAWDIDQNQLLLFSEQNTLIARLGGNQRRVTGDIEGSFASIVLERTTGDPFQPGFSNALKKHRCIYLGYSSTCATSDDLALPVMGQDGGVVASLGVIVQLNVRDQPRRDSRVVGTLPPETCLKVNYCTTASDGIWCRARFGEASGWVAKTALRQSEWPVVTFVNGCSEP
ncbi:SH3 domain-containing protein [Cribrihabitans sp. XS_ASV171]